MNPSYRPILEYHFPTAKYIQHKSRGGCVTAQGELKKVEFDPKKAHQGRAVLKIKFIDRGGHLFNAIEYRYTKFLPKFENFRFW